MEAILFNDFVWDVGQGNFHILKPGHGGFIVKIFDVQGHEAGAGCGYGGVEEVLCSCQTSALDGGGAGEVEAVTAHSNVDTVHFSFSWSDGGNHSGVGYFAPLRDSSFCYKEDCVGASWHAGADALC